MVVGFDIVIGSRYYDGVGEDFGQIAENTMLDKYYDANRLRDYTLQNDLCGGWEYLQGDINLDCYVDFDDLALMAVDWLD